MQIDVPTPSVPGGSADIAGGDGFGVNAGTIVSFEPPANSPPPSIVIHGNPMPNAGTIRFDASLQITGSFKQQATGALRMFIGGNQMPGQSYSQLIVGQDVSLAGAIELVLQPEFFSTFSYTPKVGDTFDLIKATGGITIAATGLNLLTLLTNEGAGLLGGLTLTHYDSGITADPDQLQQISETLFQLDLILQR